MGIEGRITSYRGIVVYKHILNTGAWRGVWFASLVNGSTGQRVNVSACQRVRRSQGLLYSVRRTGGMTWTTRAYKSTEGTGGMTWACIVLLVLYWWYSAI